MNKKSLGFTSFNKKIGKFQSCFYDPILKKQKHLGFHEKIEDAEQKVIDFVFDFYSENSILLPKGIHVNRKQRLFSFCLTIKNKNIHVLYSKNLSTVFKARIDFISNLI